MRMYDLIMKKRNNEELSKEEIVYFVNGYTNGKIPDYQVSALLMAIYFNKMNKRETADLTMAMVDSGETIDLSAINGKKVDKHSTGGVGDTTTLVLAPLVAAAGVKVAKMSGRGLGHTGGTIDKLEAFDGFSVEMSIDNFIERVNKYNVAIAGQTANLAPADKKLYALRDVTATVDNLSLIASSIMSKKLAAGADSILLDVKTGSGAFMKEEDDSFKLAKEMVNIGDHLGRNTIGVITDMDQPLGNAIGNALEVIEAIDTLKGQGPEDLTELCLTLGSYMLVLGEVANDYDSAYKTLEKIIEDGEGIKKLKELVKIQGGNPDYVDNIELFKKADIIEPIKIDNEGYVKSINAEDIGIAALTLGAGRETKESEIDTSVGLILHKKIGDYVNKDDNLATIYSNDKNKMKAAIEIVKNAYKFSSQKVEVKPLIRGIVTKNGIEKFNK